MARRRRLGGAEGPSRGSQQAEQLCRAYTSGRSQASNAAGRVRAAQADRCLFFLCLRRRCLELLSASGTLPSRGCPSWAGAWVLLGLRAGRGRWVETPGSRRGQLHLPRYPPLHPFRAGPVRSWPGEASAAAPPASGVRAPARQRGKSSRAGRRVRRRGGVAASRGATSPRACAARPRLRGKEALERASPRPGARDWGRGAGGGAPGRSPERRRGSARWVRGAEEDGPAAAGSARRPRPPPPPRRACFPERPALGAGRLLQPPPLPGAAGRSRRAIPASRPGPGGDRRAEAGGEGAGERWGPGSGLAPPPRAQSAGIAQQLQ